MIRYLAVMGWTLIHSCWELGLVALLYGLVDACFAKTRSSRRYLLALSALLLIPAVALGTLLYEENRVFSQKEEVRAQLFDTVNAENLVPGVSLVHPGRASWGLRDFDMKHVLEIIDVAWILGFVGFGLRFLKGWVYLRRLEALIPEEVPNGLSERFKTLAARFGLDGRVALRLCAEIPGPITIGVFRAVAILPAASVLSLDPMQLEAILIHELAHVRRADYFWNVVQTAIEAVFFFHPAVLWLGHRLRSLREHCCDDIAVSVCEDPLIYASALLQLEEMRSAQLQLSVAFSRSENPHVLRERIARLLGVVPLTRSLPLSKPALVACTFLLIALPLTLAPIRTTLGFGSEVFASGPETSPALVEPIRPDQLASVRNRVRSGIEKLVQAKISRVNSTGAPIQPESSYRDALRAEGYNLTEAKLAEFAQKGISSQYVSSLQAVGLPRPTPQEVITLHQLGIDDRTVASFRASGMVPHDFRDVIAWQLFDVDAEYMRQIELSGYPSLSPEQALKLRLSGVTPEYAKSIRAEMPGAVSAEDLAQFYVDGVDAGFIELIKSCGQKKLDVQSVVNLRLRGRT